MIEYSDLRWNNIGIVGGRSALAMLQYNKTLTDLELSGNNITQDIVKAIGEIVYVKHEKFADSLWFHEGPISWLCLSLNSAPTTTILCLLCKRQISALAVKAKNA